MFCSRNQIGTVAQLVDVFEWRKQLIYCCLLEILLHWTGCKNMKFVSYSKTSKQKPFHSFKFGNLKCKINCEASGHLHSTSSHDTSLLPRSQNLVNCPELTEHISGVTVILLCILTYRRREIKIWNTNTINRLKFV